MTRMHCLIALSLVGLLSPQTASAAAAFGCPWQPIADRPAAAVARLLPSAEALGDDAEISATVSLLRERGLSSGAIVDSIISAYCPAVADQADLSEVQKADALEAYAARVTDMVYVYSTADEIILDVPLPPAVASRVRSSASDAGLSADAWVASVIDEALVGATP